MRLSGGSREGGWESSYRLKNGRSGARNYSLHSRSAARLDPDARAEPPADFKFSSRRTDTRASGASQDAGRRVRAAAAEPLLQAHLHARADRLPPAQPAGRQAGQVPLLPEKHTLPPGTAPPRQLCPASLQPRGLLRQADRVGPGVRRHLPALGRAAALRLRLPDGGRGDTAQQQTAHRQEPRVRVPEALARLRPHHQHRRKVAREEEAPHPDLPQRAAQGLLPGDAPRGRHLRRVPALGNRQARVRHRPLRQESRSRYYLRLRHGPPIECPGESQKRVRAGGAAPDGHLPEALHQHPPEARAAVQGEHARPGARPGAEGDRGLRQRGDHRHEEGLAGLEAAPGPGLEQQREEAPAGDAAGPAAADGAERRETHRQRPPGRGQHVHVRRPRHRRHERLLDPLLPRPASRVPGAHHPGGRGLARGRGRARLRVLQPAPLARGLRQGGLAALPRDPAHRPADQQPDNPAEPRHPGGHDGADQLVPAAPRPPLLPRARALQARALPAGGQQAAELRLHSVQRGLAQLHRLQVRDDRGQGHRPRPAPRLQVSRHPPGGPAAPPLPGRPRQRRRHPAQYYAEAAQLRAGSFRISLHDCKD